MIQHPASCLCSLSRSLTGRQLLPPRPGPEPFITSCANTCWHSPRIKDTIAKKVPHREDQRRIDGRMVFFLCHLTNRIVRIGAVYHSQGFLLSRVNALRISALGAVTLI